VCSLNHTAHCVIEQILCINLQSILLMFICRLAKKDFCQLPTLLFLIQYAIQGYTEIMKTIANNEQLFCVRVFADYVHPHVKLS
jgi:hypothetical protein